MAFSTGSQSGSLQGKRTSFGPNTPVNASLLLEKTKANIRRSTPDSEALASSDDEQEQFHRLTQVNSNPIPKPVRRASWRTENYNTQRKSSLTGSETFSTAHNSTSDGNSWGSSSATLGRASSTSAFPWGSTIWNDSKGPPARLAEMMSSTTSLGSSVTEEPLSSPPIRRDSGSEAAFPFAIPLQPTLKAYRSQSYSVGQLDQDSVNNNHVRYPQNSHTGRTRAGSSYAGLQHRPSRPSMLNDFSPDTSILEQLREVEDDDEGSTASSEAGVRLPNSQARTIEQLAIENAMLRQQAYLNLGPSGTGLHAATQPALSQRIGGNRGLHMNESVVEEPDDSSLNADDSSNQGHES
jgi:hypothetical protein